MTAEHHHDLVGSLVRAGSRISHPGRPGSGTVRRRRRPFVPGVIRATTPLEAVRRGDAV